MTIDRRVSDLERRLGSEEPPRVRVVTYDRSLVPADAEGRDAFFKALRRPTEAVVFFIPDNGRGESA
ncbi:MAG: hypothetical protein H0T86_15525 [Gemmatimonadales bacterium]|nr:hypothetical protein [Gemmatimonadales bacterium]